MTFQPEVDEVVFDVLDGIDPHHRLTQPEMAVVSQAVYWLVKNRDLPVLPLAHPVVVDPREDAS